MKINFVTSNAAKVASVSRVLGSHGIEVVRADADLPELQAETAEEIARGKVRAAFALVGGPVIVIDSALHIDALGGFPGTYVKHATKQLGLQGYFDLLARFPAPERRTCRFEDALAYMDAAVGIAVFVRRESGRIASEPRGDPSGHKSLMAAVFIPDRHEKTIAEMTADELLAYRSRPETERIYRDLAGFLTGAPTSFE